MSDANMGKKLKGKDLITIGIFSAIYFVINFAFMLLGGIHPVLWMLMPGRWFAWRANHRPPLKGGIMYGCYRTNREK